MLKEMKHIEHGVSSGTICYQLLPGLHPISSFLNRATPFAAGFMSEDPFASLSNEEFTHDLQKLSHRHITVHNCTSLTEHFLRKGGMKIHSHGFFHRMPWDITPNALSDAVQKDPRAKRVV